MKTDNKIKTVIIDDDEEYISSLKKQLAIYPTIEIVGTATKYTKGTITVTVTTTLKNNNITNVKEE